MDVDSSSATVRCILETVFPENRTDLVTFNNGLKITPWHPILTHLGWQFPGTIQNIKMEPCASVYSILLDKDHVVKINDVYCITLAHNFIAKNLLHPYYGTDKIIDDLSVMPGYDDGHVRTMVGPVERNQIGEVIKITYMAVTM
jgi:hypothetical protein